MQTVPDTLTHERAAIFADYAETRAALQRAGRQVDLVALRDYLGEGRHVIESFLYLTVTSHPEQADETQRTIQRLQQNGFLVRAQTDRLQPDGRASSDLNLSMALDVQEFAARVRPDIVVLVTGQAALTPLAQRLRLQGVRVEIVATPDSVAPALRAMANGFVDLTHIGATLDPLPMPEHEPQPEREVQPECAPQPVAPPAVEDDLEWDADL
ncbi:MAG: NYN domain-containing protein [Anaerolineae bacterium]|nr:NYN domain-containing protein [Anaerolineae bacterium]